MELIEDEVGVTGTEHTSESEKKERIRLHEWHTGIHSRSLILVYVVLCYVSDKT